MLPTLAWLLAASTGVKQRGEEKVREGTILEEQLFVAPEHTLLNIIGLSTQKRIRVKQEDSKIEAWGTREQHRT